METQFKGQKKVKVADLSNAIIAELMPLEIIETDTYAGYGSENVGLQNADSKKTLLFNSPYLHGKPGHFPGDFDLDIDRNQIKVQEIPVGAQNPTEKFAVVRSDVTLTEDNIADNVFTLVATEEEAKGWISKRMHGDGENFRVKIDRPSGLFAHMRVWIDGDTLYVAEIQSDAFQSDNLMGVGFAGKIKDLQNDKAPHERNIQLHNKRIKEIESKSIIATKNDSDALSSNLYFITSFKGKGFGSINAGSASEAVEIFKSTSERAEELEEYTSSFSKKDIDDLISERNDKIKENEKNIADIDKEIKKLEDQYNMKENDAEKKFMNYRSDWHEMMVRQAIRYAAQKGLKKVRFPSTYGVALVEGYMDSGENGEGPAPYEFDGEELEVGDNLDFQGEDYTVVNIDSDYNVKIAPSKSVRTFMFSDYIQEEVESRYDEMIYSFNELEKDFGEIDTPEKAQKVLDANQIIKKTGEYNRIDDNIKDNKERFDTDPAHESVKNLQKEVDNYNKLIKLVKDDVIKKENITGEAIHNLGRKDELQEKYGVPHSFWNYMIDPWNEEDATMKTVKTETLEYIENRVIEVKKDFDVAKENLSDKQKKFEDSQRETKSRPKPTEAELKSIPPEYHNTKNTWFIDWEVEQMLEKMSESENEKVSIEDFEEDIKISMEESANDMDFQDMGYEEVFYNEQGYDTEVTTIDDGAIVEAVMQPGEYSTAPENVEDFDYTDEDMVSSDTNRTVLRFYDKQVNKYLAKLRKGNLEDVENENVPWIETNITEEDSAEVPAFKEKTTEPTSIEDEILKPKASIALFNPKSDTNVKTEEGYFTNKYWLLKPEFIPKTLASRIDNNMSMIKDKPKSEVLFESAREGDPQSVTNIIGYVKDRIRTSYILKSPNPIYGEYIEVNKEYYDYLAKNIKDFSLLGKDSASALIVMSGDKEAGLLMPIKGTEEDKIKFIEEMTTKEGDVVLDPFAGSGVTAAEAVKTGRRAVAIEKSPEAVEGVIKPRIEQALREVENIDDTPLTYTTQLEGPENTTVGEAKERLRYLNTLTGEEGGADEQAVASEEIEAIEKALGVVEKQTAGVTLKPKPVAPAARPVVAEVTKAAKPTERPSTKVVTEEKPGVVKDVKTEAKKLKSAVKDVKRVVKENSNLSKEYQKSLTEAIEKEGLPKIDVAEEFYPDNLGSNNPYTKFAVGWFNSLRDLVREHRWFPSWLKIKNSKELLAIAREKNRIIDGMKSVLQEDIVKPLKKLTQEEKLNIGLMVNKNIQVTEEYKGVVKNIDTAIGRLGKGIVDIYKEWEEKGLIKPNEVLLSEETFFENLGKYARTFYLRPDDIGNKIQPATVNPDMLSTSMFKRKLRDEEWGRKSILVEDGKVTDDSIELISHIGPKNVIKFRDAGLNTIEKVAEAEIKDIENALGPIQKNFADSIKNSAEKVLKKNEDNIIPAPSIKELEERGLEAKKNWGWVYEADIMVSKTFDDLTKNYATTQWLDNIVNNPLFFSKEPQQGFIKTSSLLPKGVKTNIKLGPLNSGYINEGLRDEVDHLIKTGNSTASEAYKNFRKVLSWWKWSKVAVNPPTMIRNLISGHIIQTDMAGYPVWYPENTIGYAKSFMDYAQKKGIYKEARAAGLYGSDFYSIEISPDIEKRLLEIESKKDVGSVLKSIVDAASKGKEVSGEFYGSIDHIARTYLYERARSQGAKKSQAVNFANKWELDYSLVPGVVELARNTGVVPFLSFYALMFPRVMEVSITRPWVLAKYSAVAVAVTAYMAAQMGMDDDELEAMKPEFLKGKPFVIPVGFDKNGDPEYMDFSYILPFGGGKELFVDFSQIEEMAKSMEEEQAKA